MQIYINKKKQLEKGKQSRINLVFCVFGFPVEQIFSWLYVELDDPENQMNILILLARSLLS